MTITLGTVDTKNGVVSVSDVLSLASRSADIIPTQFLGAEVVNKLLSEVKMNAVTLNTFTDLKAASKLPVLTYFVAELESVPEASWSIIPGFLKLDDILVRSHPRKYQRSILNSFVLI
jgi:hypothetical protein